MTALILVSPDTQEMYIPEKQQTYTSIFAAMGEWRVLIVLSTEWSLQLGVHPVQHSTRALMPCFGL